MEREKHRCSHRVTTMLATALMLATMAAPAGAQETGTVRGAVTLTETGDPVHGAVILVVGAGSFALTDELGMFAVENVPPGDYEVLAQREHLTAGRQMVSILAGGDATVDFVLGLSPVHEDVTVTASVGGAETTFEAFNAVTTIDSFDIVGGAEGSLGDALRSEPGIASRSFGPGSSRPVIRGFDGDRVLILQDGIRTGDLSSQSGDHGVTIDPNSAERIEIVRGPATLLYGSNAVGGLVNVVTPHESYRESRFVGTRAQFNVDGGSANQQVGTNASVQHGQGNVLVWAGASARRTDDYQTPLGTIGNSATELINGRTGVGYFGDRFFTSGGITLEDGRYGVPFADEFHGHGQDADEAGHEGEDGHAEEEAHAEEVSIDLDSRRRVGRFDIGVRNLDNRAIDGARVSLSLIDWQHDELEVTDGIESIGTLFTNRSTLVRAEVDQRQTDRLAGKFGAWAQFRDFEAIGIEALAPQTDQTSFAAFAYEELNAGRFRLQFGARVEQNDYRTAERTGGHGHDEEDDQEEDEHHLEAPDPRDRDFLGASASVGLHADLGADTAFVANLTSSHRAPALEELYNFGPHVGNLAFEVGNPELDAETTLGLDLSLRHQSDRVRSELNVYTYGIHNFIFGERTDEVEDDLPVLDFTQGDSRFVGFDARGSIRLAQNAWVTLGLGYVDARLTATDEPLPRIPPLRGTLSLDLPIGGFTLSPEVEFAGAQDRLYRGETATEGYSVVNLRASYVWPRQHTAHILSVTGYNLTDATYRNHTSFIKDLAPEIGRGVRVGYSVRFF